MPKKTPRYILDKMAEHVSFVGGNNFHVAEEAARVAFTLSLIVSSQYPELWEKLIDYNIRRGGIDSELRLGFIEWVRTAFPIEEVVDA